MKKFILMGAGVVLVALVVWQVIVRLGEDSGGGWGGRRGSASVAVELAPVETGGIRETKAFSGTIRPRSYVLVAPKIGGRLEELKVDVGDSVRSGDLIAVLDDDELVQQVEQATAELKVAAASLKEAESSLEVVEKEFERFKDLHSRNIASEAELETAEARYLAEAARVRVAEAQQERRNAELRAAQVRLAYTRISAEWEGEGDRLVGERFVDEGATLRANDPIVSLIDIDSVLAVIHATERDYFHVRPDQAASVTTDALPGESFSGKVARIAPLLKETSRQARIEIEIPNPDRKLRPGMFARIRIELRRRDHARIVPGTALVRRKGTEGVFVADLEKKTASFVPVKTGIREGNRVEILEPELTGHVVTLGHHLLEDGGGIRIPKDPGGSGPPAPRETR